LFEDKADKNAYWNTPPQVSVTAQLRDLAEIEKMYAEQSRLASTPLIPPMESGFSGGYLPDFSYTTSTFYPPFISAPLQTMPIAPTHSFSHHSGGGFSHGGGGHFGH
jgi:hypothetical protein